MKQYKISPKYADELTPLLFNIREFFPKNGITVHKARNELKVFQYKSYDLVVKSFKIPHLLNRLIYSFFRDTKAKKSYKNSLKIIQFVPKPIAYIEFYNFWLLKRSYFISEKFDFNFTIREPLLDSTFKDRQNILRAFARFTLQLHNFGIFHKDYSPGNILIKKTQKEYIFKIVDINRMEFKQLSQRNRAKGFAKLWADDDLLKIIADEYALHYNVDKKFKNQVLYFSNKNKKIKNIKKRLKGQPVND